MSKISSGGSGFELIPPLFSNRPKQGGINSRGELIQGIQLICRIYGVFSCNGQRQLLSTRTVLMLKKEITNDVSNLNSSDSIREDTIPYVSECVSGGLLFQTVIDIGDRIETRP
mgnify:CR=1 FL=1